MASSISVFRTQAWPWVFGIFLVFAGYSEPSALMSSEGVDEGVMVALTAHALLEHREQCRHAQMNAFISKPFTTQDLRAVLELFHQNRSGDPFHFYS